MKKIKIDVNNEAFRDVNYSLLSVILFIFGIISLICGIKWKDFRAIFFGASALIFGFRNFKMMSNKCPECHTHGGLKHVKNEIVDTKVLDRQRYIQHTHEEGDYTHLETTGFDDSKYYTNMESGTRKCTGTVRTEHREFVTRHYVKDTFVYYYYKDVEETHRSVFKCEHCGHIENHDKVVKKRDYIVKPRERNKLDDELLQLMKEGVPFRSNVPDFNGLTYDMAIQAKALADNK